MGPIQRDILMRTISTTLLACLAAVALSGCTEEGFGNLSAFGDNASTIADTASLDYYPDDELIVASKVQFKNGHFGKAGAYARKALEVAPSDPQALLLYAAAQDRLRRFDEADKAYRKLQPVIGNRIEFHNNYGYSMMLRGNLVAARKHFIAAYEIDPSNATVANNLELLRNSTGYPRRASGDLQGI